MKRFLKLTSFLLAVCCLLGACSMGGANTTGSTTTSSSTTVPTTTTQPVVLDPNRPLPTLAEKFVTDTPEAGDLVLAQDGVANATIVYPAGHAKASSAAADLSNYLTKITGATFVTVTDDQILPEGNLILVGPTAKTLEMGIGPFTGYPEAEKLTITRKDNCLILYGNDDETYAGTQNAVTYFLEEAGCGWYADDELWQVVPECPTLAVKDVEFTASPTISARRLGWRNFDRWYCGGDRFREGHALTGLISGKWCYENQPEWLALWNGSRDDYSTGNQWQYCYTNADFATAIAEKIIAYFDKNPTVTAFSVSPNDGWNDGWCQCDTCTATGNHSDQILLFANRIAEIVSQKHPDKLISFLAYHSVFLPPEKDTKAHPNVQVMFCVETNPLDDLMADRQLHNGYNWINQIEYSQSWLDNVTEYIEKTDLQHTAIWGWFCISDPGYGWQGAPWVQGNVATRNIQVFEDLGVEHVFYDGTSSGNDLSLRWPVMYVFARNMYFDNMDGEQILYDACKKLYGEAADEMFLYYRILADSAQESASPSGVNWVPPPLLDVYGNNYNLIQDAVAAARAKLDLLTPEQKERVEDQLRSWLFVEIYM